MKNSVEGTLVVLIAILVAGLGLAAPAEAKCCSCTAPGGSCSASSCCREGCYAICLRDHCESGCSDSSTGVKEANGDEAGAAGEGARMSFSHDQATAEQVSKIVSRAMKAQVVFAPFAADEPFSVDIQNASAARVVEVLSKFGVVTVGGARASGRRGAALEGDQRFSFEAKDLPVQRLAELLSRALGREVTISSEAGEKVSLQFQEAPVEKVLRLLAKTAEVRVDGEQILPY